MTRPIERVQRSETECSEWTSDAGMGEWPLGAAMRGGGTAENSVGLEWAQLRSAIAAALRPHPEALGAVKEVLGRWSAA